ncbi:MAG: DUF2975 domain-containing protein [Bacteroidetes bacterium]|nr:DUF2975 domain-containing protein [Bacteroidota bacterium]
MNPESPNQTHNPQSPKGALNANNGPVPAKAPKRITALVWLVNISIVILVLGFALAIAVLVTFPRLVDHSPNLTGATQYSFNAHTTLLGRSYRYEYRLDGPGQEPVQQVLKFDRRNLFEFSVRDSVMVNLPRLEDASNDEILKGFLDGVTFGSNAGKNELSAYSENSDNEINSLLNEIESTLSVGGNVDITALQREVERVVVEGGIADIAKLSNLRGLASVNMKIFNRSESVPVRIGHPGIPLTVDEFKREVRILAVGLALTMIYLIVVMWYIRGFITGLRNMTFFTEDNLRKLNIAAIMLTVGPLLYGLFSIIFIPQYPDVYNASSWETGPYINNGVIVFLFGLLLLAISWCFRYGVDIQKEQEFTV